MSVFNFFFYFFVRIAHRLTLYHASIHHHVIHQTWMTECAMHVKVDFSLQWNWAAANATTLRSCRTCHSRVVFVHVNVPSPTNCRFMPIPLYSQTHNPSIHSLIHSFIYSIFWIIWFLAENMDVVKRVSAEIENVPTIQGLQLVRPKVCCFIFIGKLLPVTFNTQSFQGVPGRARLLLRVLQQWGMCCKYCVCV